MSSHHLTQTGVHMVRDLGFIIYIYAYVETLAARYVEPDLPQASELLKTRKWGIEVYVLAPSLLFNSECWRTVLAFLSKRQANTRRLCAVEFDDIGNVESCRPMVQALHTMEVSGAIGIKSMSQRSGGSYRRLRTRTSGPVRKMRLRLLMWRRHD